MEVKYTDPAGHNQTQRRNDDFKRINQDLNIFNGNSLFKNGFDHLLTVSDNFDVSFIMGDLNYRIDTELNNLDK